MANFIVGILNVTPDSFSDGGQFLSSKDALIQASSMFNEGADFIDIGADSTRPGSSCIGETSEWQRLNSIVENLSNIGPWSIDTHSVEVARKAVKLGASIVNDVSGGSTEMMQLSAELGCKLVCMYSRSIGNPHKLLEGDNPKSSEILIENIKEYFDRTLVRAKSVGLPSSQLIFDPGMGSFISDNPDDSFYVLKNLTQLSLYGDLLVGVSRKGFLKTLSVQSFRERDWIGAVLSAVSSLSIPSKKNIYWRVHNVSIQKAIFNLISG